MVLYYRPSTVLSPLCAVFHLNTDEARNYYFHFTDDKIEGQQLYIICSRLQNLGNLPSEVCFGQQLFT